MKKSLLAILVVLMLTVSISAEPVSTGTDTAKNAHRYGVMSLDVYVPLTGSTADPYSPYTDGTPMISGKYFLMENSALELGFEFDFRTDKEEYPAYYADGTHIGLYGAFVHYFAKKRISPYVKAGLAIGINSGDYYELVEQDEMDFALIGGFGTEFFVTKEFSISAEGLIRLMLSPTVHFSTITPAIKASFYFDNFL